MGPEVRATISVNSQNNDQASSGKLNFSIRLAPISQRLFLRLSKQRLEKRGPILDSRELWRAVEEEWDKIMLEENNKAINKAINIMHDRVTAVGERDAPPYALPHRE